LPYKLLGYFSKTRGITAAFFKTHEHPFPHPADLYQQDFLMVIACWPNLAGFFYNTKTGSHGSGLAWQSAEEKSR
jgi:hypothetical protein